MHSDCKVSCSSSSNNNTHSSSPFSFPCIVSPPSCGFPNPFFDTMGGCCVVGIVSKEIFILTASPQSLLLPRVTNKFDSATDAEQCCCSFLFPLCRLPVFYLGIFLAHSAFRQNLRKKSADCILLPLPSPLLTIHEGLFFELLPWNISSAVNDKAGRSIIINTTIGYQFANKTL